MIQYLNGLTEIGKTKGKAKFSKPFRSFSKNVKKLDDKAKAFNRKAVEDAKRLGKIAGKGNLRKALIPNGFAFKKFLFALEKDLFNMSSRIKELYKKNPSSTKAFLSSLGDYSKIIKAVNKGAKGNAISGGYDYGCKCGNQNVYAQECCKGKHSAKTMVGDGGNAPTPEEVQQYTEYAKEGISFIQKIIDWFKKNKADKKGDNSIVPDLNDAVDTDPNIPVVDENGDALPDSPLAPKKDASYLMPVVIGGAVLIGGYFLLKKKK